MGSQLKFIVDGLNVAYPQKNYNLIAFDSLNPDQLLQVLSNVLTLIETKEEIDIRDESREQTTKRILNTLHVLKYRFPNNELEWAQALVLGDKTCILPLLEWLLQQRTLLEKRAYLAKFLMRVEIPTVLRGESSLEELYENYEQMLDAFKEAHRDRESLLTSSANTAELRGDLAVMERERDIVAAKVATHHKTRVDGSKSASVLLTRVQLLREAKSKRDTLVEQKSRLEANCAELERFVARTKQQVAEARRAAQGVTPHGLLQRAEEEMRVSVYIAQEKLPADLESTQNQLEVLRQVTSQTGLTRTDLAQVEQEVRSLSVEVNALLERRMAAAGPAEDKLAPFRQQVAMLGRRKESAAEALGSLRREAASLRGDLNELQAQMSQGEDASMPLTEEQFRTYVVQLRARTEVYKARRGQLSAQAAECGVLARTVEILKARQDAALRLLAAEEARLGLSGFTVAATQLEEVAATKAQLDAQKEQTLESLSKTIVELNQIISAKKAQLAPAIQELRPLREQYQVALADFNKVKQLYETTAANLGSTSAKLEQEVRQMEEESQNSSSQTALTLANLEVALARQKTLVQELELYKAGPSPDKPKSMREQLNIKIAEEERKGRQLKETQRRAKDREPQDERQVLLWQNVERLFQAKQDWLEKSRQNSGEMRRERGAETLVLQ